MDSLIVYLNDIPVGRLTDDEKQAPLVAEKLSARFPSPCYGRIVEGIFRRSKQLGESAV